MTTETEQGYLLDVNVLIALAWPQHIHHARAHAWWKGIARWATTPVTEAAFVRLSINPAAIEGSVSFTEATSMLRAVREAPGHEFIIDDTSLAEPEIDLSAVVTSRQVTDAHLVNLAARHARVLATLDRGIPEMLAESDRRYVLVLPNATQAP